MGRCRRVFVAALLLTALAAGMGITRFLATGGENQFPPGPGNFRVTLLVRGKSSGDPRLITACPLDMGGQHVHGETFSSDQFTGKVMESRFGERRHVQWTPRLGSSHPFEVRYQFHCSVDVSRPNGSMKRIQQHLYAAPRAGEFLHSDPGIDPSAAEISAAAQNGSGDGEKPIDQVRSLFRFIQQGIQKEPTTLGPGRSGLECLSLERGNALEQGRLLAALLRNRGFPARLVHGLILRGSTEPSPHAWVETWVDDHWVSLCPHHDHFGKVPHSYLIFGYGDMLLVRGQNLAGLEQGFLVEHLPNHEARAAATGSALARFFHRLSLYNLPPPEFRLVELLLQLPLAALLICLFRNVVGLQSFGTFTPALLGLAFRELETLPGMLIFVVILLVGWGLRRVLDRFHLLQVPRTAVMLTLIVTLLISFIVLANERGMDATRFLALFPLVIMTGMIERFWTLEAEDGALASFRTLLNTLVMAGVIAVTLSWAGLIQFLIAYPESVGVLLAGQLLIGRYTGYRLTEIWRFRDLVEEPEPAEQALPSSRAA